MLVASCDIRRLGTSGWNTDQSPPILAQYSLDLRNCGLFSLNFRKHMAARDDVERTISKGQLLDVQLDVDISSEQVASYIEGTGQFLYSGLKARLRSNVQESR